MSNRTKTRTPKKNLIDRVADVESISTTLEDSIEALDVRVTSIEENLDNTLYSLEETVIGAWVDGRPLYRKVIVIPTTGANTVEEVLIRDLDLDNLINTQSVFRVHTDTDNSQQMSNNNDENWQYYYSLTVLMFNGQPNDTLTANFAIGSDSSDYEYRYGIIEYTKTTDL